MAGVGPGLGCQGEGLCTFSVLFPGHPQRVPGLCNTLLVWIVTSLALNAFKSLLSHLPRQVLARLTLTLLASKAILLCTFVLPAP